ncbi:hypothetical protein [Haliangium sp.]|uniref:hypothetical protein n=1 Tax=Haliangium sp. TaxID=2663208 RepID=UPI003D0B2A0A
MERRALVLVATILMAISLAATLGANWLPVPDADRATLARAASEMVTDDMPEPDVDELMRSRRENPPRPGLAIPALALLDALLLFMAVAMLSKHIRGRLQLLLTAGLSLLLVIGAFILFFVALALLLLMIGLFLAIPFGTLVYLALWGFFDRGGAGITLGLLMSLHIGYGVCLALSNPRLLTNNRTLVLLTLTALLAIALTSFLHGIVPGVLVSITDVVAALIVTVLGGVWALIYLIRCIIALITTAS